jgi:hypothetical protein
MYALTNARNALFPPDANGISHCRRGLDKKLNCSAHRSTHYAMSETFTALTKGDHFFLKDCRYDFRGEF